jgi:hypothetical protein
MPANQGYTLLHTSSMVGLFSCVFVKTALRGRIKQVHTAEVKRGMGGLHGNKVRQQAHRFLHILTIVEGRVNHPYDPGRQFNVLGELPSCCRPDTDASS